LRKVFNQGRRFINDGYTLIVTSITKRELCEPLGDRLRNNGLKVNAGPGKSPLTVQR
jgi:hypothetical protein